VLIYREIDITFSVACLAALSYETMVKELKSAVPSFQSDFSRLKIVAQVGEELSHLWDQEPLLLLFQGLQTNAKWWHILSQLGIKVDLRVFQSPDAALRERFIRSVIPELFEKGGMDLEMVTEYCRQFDLEPEYATLTYIELLLTSPVPSAPGDLSWAGKVRSAAHAVEEPALLQCLRELLLRVHALDYEKIRYVCTWITDLLAAEEEEEGDDSVENANSSSSTTAAADTTTTSTSAAEEEEHDVSMDASTTTGGGSSSSSSSGRLKPSSLRGKAQKVSSSGHRGSRGSEREAYHRLLEIAGYLSGLKFPKEATALIRVSEVQATSPLQLATVRSSSGSAAASTGGAGSGAARRSYSPYAGVTSSLHQERIPMWALLDEPWAVLEPLLTNVPEAAGKLAPLCPPLRIDKSEFSFRKALAMYARMTSHTSAGGSACAVAVVAGTSSSKESKLAAFQSAAEAIETSAFSPQQQAELWCWVYAREICAGDDEQALRALQAGLKVAEAHTALVMRSSYSIPGAGSANGSETTFFSYFTTEMRFVNCKRTIKRFGDEYLTDFPKVRHLLLSCIAQPQALVRCLLDVVVELSWDWYVRGMLQLGTPLSCYALSQYRPNHAVQAFVAQAGRVVDEIAAHCGLNLPPAAATATASGGGGGGSAAAQEGAAAANTTTTQLELLRHNMIGRMLSDVDTSGGSGGAGNSGGSGGSKGDGSSSGSGGSGGSMLAAGSGTGGGGNPSSAAAAIGFWGLAGTGTGDGSDASYVPSAAERRRREDVYLSMGIAVLVLTCSSPSQR
jgi:uncharacterized membrane protein YgcG